MVQQTVSHSIPGLPEASQSIQPTSVVLPLWKWPDPETGEYVGKYRYLPGDPRPIRFDAKSGIFTVDGQEVLGKTLTFQPIAWRVFEAEILGQPRKRWAELFYADERLRICALLLHGYSVENLLRLAVPLFYDEKTLADVLLTVTAIEKENTKIKPKGIYYLAEFEYVDADPEAVREGTALAAAVPLFRMKTVAGETLTITQHQYRLLAQDAGSTDTWSAA